MSLSEVCKTLIEEGNRYNVSHGNNLTNHLPMALIALDKIGAGEEELHIFYNDYKKKLEPLPKNSNFKKINSIEEHLGDKSYFFAFLEFFTDEISSKGYSQVLKEYIPTLIKSPSPCAFHCMIRISYAISSGLSLEIATALAYWASEFTLYKCGTSVGEIQVTNELEKLSLKFQNFNFNGNNISARMMEADKLLLESGCPIVFPEYSLESIAKLALKLYAQTRNFTLLHGVTATHAFRTLLPYIDNKNLALQHLWNGLILAFLSTGISATDLLPVTHSLHKVSWEDIFKKSVKSADAHTVKLTYTAWEEWKFYNNDLYMSVALKKNNII